MHSRDLWTIDCGNSLTRSRTDYTEAHYKRIHIGAMVPSQWNIGRDGNVNCLSRIRSGQLVVFNDNCASVQTSAGGSDAFCTHFREAATV